jgi:hypothetical protein
MYTQLTPLVYKAINDFRDRLTLEEFPIHFINSIEAYPTRCLTSLPEDPGPDIYPIPCCSFDLRRTCPIRVNENQEYYYDVH